jgi:hypothetical protein
MEADNWTLLSLDLPSNDTTDTSIIDPSALNDNPWIHDGTSRADAEGSWHPTAMSGLQQQQPLCVYINSQTENNGGACISFPTSAGYPSEADVYRQESQARKRERNRVAQRKFQAKAKREAEHKQGHLKDLQIKNTHLRAKLSSLENERCRLWEALTDHGHYGYCGYSDTDAWITSPATEFAHQSEFNHQLEPCPQTQVHQSAPGSAPEGEGAGL